MGDTYDNMAIRNKPNCKIHKTNHSSEGNDYSKHKNAWIFLWSQHFYSNVDQISTENSMWTFWEYSTFV